MLENTGRVRPARCGRVRSLVLAAWGVAAVVMLSGCVRVDLGMLFGDDSSGRFSVAVAVDKFFLETSGLSDCQGFLEDEFFGGGTMFGFVDALSEREGVTASAVFVISDTECGFSVDIEVDSGYLGDYFAGQDDVTVTEHDNGGWFVRLSAVGWDYIMYGGGLAAALLPGLGVAPDLGIGDSTESAAPEPGRMADPSASEPVEDPADSGLGISREDEAIIAMIADNAEINLTLTLPGVAASRNALASSRVGDSTEFVWEYQGWEGIKEFAVVSEFAETEPIASPVAEPVEDSATEHEEEPEEEPEISFYMALSILLIIFGVILILSIIVMARYI